MMKWWKKFLRQKVLELLEKEEEKLINFMEGKIPKRTDPPQVKMEYWRTLMTSLSTPAALQIMYRVQVMYNRIQLSQLQNSPRDEKQSSLLQAKQQALYEVLQLPRTAEKMFLIYVEQAKNPEKVDASYKEEMPLGPTPEG